MLDLETDPFLYGRKPEPFAAGFYDGATYWDYWGADCVAALASYLEFRPDPLLIYAHNGGRFDFFYFVEAGLVNDPIMIINGRLVKLGLGIHELRDSFAIIPVALKEYEKTKIDYDKFEADKRERHKPEILSYLRDDCLSLYKIVSAFVERFGPMLTVGGTAIKELAKFHKIIRGDAAHDALFRPFYYGGRVSVFEPGLHFSPVKKFKSFDVNSMYPFVMKNFLHPHGKQYLHFDHTPIDAWGNLQGYQGRPYFAIINAVNRQALPTRTNTGLTFDQEKGEFLACSHEIRTALKHGLLDIIKVKRAWLPLRLISFDRYVDYWMAEKIEGKNQGDRLRELFAKFLLNSAYGKFGQNPAHYYDYKIKRACEKIRGREWLLHMDYGEWEIWRKPAPKPRYFDVAVAASITSAARAVLLDALQSASRPMCCDTDNVICEGLDVPLSDTVLGAWKVEATGDRLGLAGKKMYALFSGRQCVKMASKGADLDPLDILALAKGEAVIWLQDAPTFKLGRPDPAFIDRVLSRTA